MNRKMIALIIGNGDYQQGTTKLDNAVNDAEDMAKELDALGFTVIKHLDCQIDVLDRAVSAFQDGLNSNDVGLFYFAGHGIQIDGENYITAIDTTFTDEPAVKYSSFPLNRLIESMDKCSNRTNLIILDACRDNPCKKGWARSASAISLAPMFAPKGTLIAYSTSPGETASDGVGRNGAYTEALLKHIKTPDIAIEEVFKKVRNSLSVATQGRQTSWEHTSLTGDFHFNLSLGSKIDKYSKIAIADELFTEQDNNSVHNVIECIRSRNWYKQNPAIDRLNAAFLINADNDTLFVLGRNIYQSACGDAGSAVDFIDNFRSKLSGLQIDKVLCILEGMLFEIFFNAEGEFRDSFKVTMFDAVFKLNVFQDYKPAFDFISEVLLPYQNQFYILPGKAAGNVVVDLLVKQGAGGGLVIYEIHFGGDNILYPEDDWEKYSFDGKLSYDPYRYDALIEKISKDMMIPKESLSLQANMSIDEDSNFEYPYRHSIKKG